MHKKKEVVQTIEPIVQGTFPAQKFFDTLALILSARENVKITVKAELKEKDKKAV